MNDSCQRLWDAFLASGLRWADEAAEKGFVSWQFGLGPEMADRLLGRVMNGRKRATAGSLSAYEMEGEPVPEVGEYSVILDGAGAGRCIIRTSRVDILPFDEVGSEHATLEGDDDPSLERWREVHWRFFQREAEEFGSEEPRPDLLVVCERFEVVYPLEVADPGRAE